MLKKIINRFIRPRHFWRTVSFDELSELYITQFLRSLSISLIGIFVPIYFYKIGFSVTEIMIFFVAWFAIRPIWSYVSAKIIGIVGPKHAIAFSIVIQICYLSLVLTVQSLGWPLWLIAIVGSFCFGLYIMAFGVDFSKVKHAEHDGKELGYLQIFERLGAIVGPVIGGLIASFIDPRYTIALAIFVLCGSLYPILRTAEQIQKQQTIALTGFPWRKYLHNMNVHAAFSLERYISITVWPLYIGIFIFSENTYAALGLLTAIGTVAGFVAIFSIGKLMDNHHSRRLLNIGIILNTILYIGKIFTKTSGVAWCINTVNQPISVMYRMPFMKGMYDEADAATGYRIEYFMVQDMINAVISFIFWVLLASMSILLDTDLALRLSFIIGIGVSLAMIKQHYAALRLYG